LALSASQLLRYDGRDVRWIPLVGLALVLGSLAAACGDDGETPPTPEGPTTLALAKTVLETTEGKFRFTLVLTNEGVHAAVNVAMSDVWERGLEVTAIGSVDGQQPEDIGDFGLEFTLREFEAGKTVETVYTASCRESGEWQNVAVASSANAEPVEASVTVVCP
jgi:hypothetical protein